MSRQPIHAMLCATVLAWVVLPSTRAKESTLYQHRHPASLSHIVMSPKNGGGRKLVELMANVSYRRHLPAPALPAMPATAKDRAKLVLLNLHQDFLNKGTLKAYTHQSKIVVVLRDSTVRAATSLLAAKRAAAGAQHVHRATRRFYKCRLAGPDPRSARDCIFKPRVGSFLAPGLYDHILEPLINSVPRGNICIVLYKWLSNPASLSKTVASIYQFMFGSEPLNAKILSSIARSSRTHFPPANLTK